jgi:hypothetical protein
VAAGEPGTDLFLDVVLPGLQSTLEHRIPWYGQANQINLRANVLYTSPFLESQADAELRLLVLTLGASGGGRYAFTNQSYRSDEEFDRHARRLRFVDGDQSSEAFGFGEGRATLSLPINDYVVFNGINTLRFEDSPDRTYDFRTGVVHDGGSLFKSDLMLFLKHRDWGALAPMMQILNFGLGDERFTQFNYGFLLATRPGFLRANDIFFVQFLFHPGSTLGGYDNATVYGNHLLFSPINVTIAYRVILPMWRPDP